MLSHIVASEGYLTVRVGMSETNMPWNWEKNELRKCMLPLSPAMKYSTSLWHMHKIASPCWEHLLWHGTGARTVCATCPALHMYVPQMLSESQANASLLTGPPAPGSAGVCGEKPMFQMSHGQSAAAECSCTEFYLCHSHCNPVFGRGRILHWKWILYFAGRGSQYELNCKCLPQTPVYSH